MKLTRLVLENFRGAPNGTYSFLPPSGGAPLSLVLITGGRASGKTAFLEAIAALKESVGSYGAPPHPGTLLRRGTTMGRIEGTWLLSPEERERGKLDDSTLVTRLDLGDDVIPPLHHPDLRALFEAYSHASTQSKFEYFPSNRRLIAAETTISLESEEARLRLTRKPTKYAGIVGALVELAFTDGIQALEMVAARGLLMQADQPDSLAPYKNALADLLPDLRLIGVQIRGGKPVVRFERPDGAMLDLHELSESEQQALLYCVTFLRIGLNHSVVLVDEPELHLHADDHARFLRALTALGVDNQLFVATGSAEILRAAPPHQVLRLGLNTR